MEKFITKSEVADFVMRMWDEGYDVSTEPRNSQVVLKDKNGKYRWIPVKEHATCDEVVDSILNPKEED